jgi:hypothetical protein
MPKFSDFVSNPIQATTDTLVTALKPALKLGQWSFENPIEAAILGAGGYYFAPQIGAWLAPTGEAVAGTAAGTEAGAALLPATEVVIPAGSSAVAPVIADAATAASTGLTTSQLASLAKAGISLAGIVGATKAIPTNTGGGGLLTQQQDRSGFSSGSANYSPEYYAAIQNKYNQYMPQAKGADITTDLKNWYETKYTPVASTAGVATPTTTGTGYTTSTSMTNLGIQPQAKTPTPPPLLPSVASLTPTSNATDVAKAFADWSAANGGNTEANRSTAITYLRSIGIPDSAIQSGYSSYLSAQPASTGNTPTTMAANSSAQQIAQAYATYAAANGGDNQANQAAVITYLRQIGVPDSTIQAAYPIYKSSMTQAAPAAGGGGMLTGGTTTQQAAPIVTAPVATAPVAQAPVAQAPAVQQAQPLYETLGANSSPQAIAKAYQQFLGSNVNDTAANQQAANQYLTNLGISQDTIGQAYGLFKG